MYMCVCVIIYIYIVCISSMAAHLDTGAFPGKAGGMRHVRGTWSPAPAQPKTKEQ